MTTILAEKVHATLGPSGWDWWSNCPGGPVLAEGRPNPTSIYAAWGTAAHEIAARCLTDNADAETFIGEVFVIGEEKHRIEVDMEMADAVNDAVAQARLFVPEGDALMVEQDVPISHLTGETNATGTADVIGIVAEGTRLVVIDFKFGRGVQVFASSEAPIQDVRDLPRPPSGIQINGQMAMYALGALEKFGLVYDDIVEVELVIVQPRLDHVDSVVISVDELREFAETVTLAAGRVSLAFQLRSLLQSDIADQLGKSTREQGMGEWLNPGEKQCKFCRAKAICPALKAEVENAMGGASDAAEFEDLTLPKKAASLVPAADIGNEKLAEAFRAIPLIEEWVKGIGAEVDRRLLEGEKIPGLYLGVGKAGRRVWADPLAAERELKKRYKVDEMYDKTVISPTKAEKLMKPRPRVWATIVAEVGILQPPGRPKVCREGVDKNKPYQLPSADDFADLTIGDQSGSSALLDD